MITSWSSPSPLSTSGEPLPPPGQGNLLIKIGSRTGIPVHVDLVEAERRSDVHNTNKRWQPADPALFDAAALDTATVQAVAAGVASAAPELPAPPIPACDGQGDSDGDGAADRTRVISADLIRAASHRAGDDS